MSEKLMLVRIKRTVRGGYRGIAKVSAYEIEPIAEVEMYAESQAKAVPEAPEGAEARRAPLPMLPDDPGDAT